MTPRTRSLLGALVVAALAPSTLLSQSAASLGAATRVSTLPGREQTASLWFNGELSLEGRDWQVDFRSAGAFERGRLGAEAVLLGRWSPRLTGQSRFVLGVDGTVDQPANLGGIGVAEGRIGFAQGFGGLRLEAGAKAVAWQSRGRRYFGGGYAATSFSVQGLTLTGELSRLQATAGDLSVLDPTSSPDPLTESDTSTFAATSPTAVRTYVHAALGLAWRHGPLAARARIIRRTQVLRSEGTGWEAALSLDAIPGMRIHAALGQAPLASGMFLPYRRQLALGFELVRQLGHRSDAEISDWVGSMAFDIGSGPDGGTVVRVSHPTAQSVEVSGDFTNWEPRALMRVAPGRFQASLPIPMGVHHLNVRFDGGPWQVPPGLASSDDGFGGRTGVLVVP